MLPPPPWLARSPTPQCASCHRFYDYEGWLEQLGTFPAAVVAGDAAGVALSFGPDLMRYTHMFRCHVYRLGGGSSLCVVRQSAAVSLSGGAPLQSATFEFTPLQRGEGGHAGHGAPMTHELFAELMSASRPLVWHDFFGVPDTPHEVNLCACVCVPVCVRVWACACVW